MSGEPPRKKTKLEAHSKKSNLKNAIRAAREDFDPPFPEDDQEADDEREDDDTNQEYEPDPDPKGHLEIAPGTRANTRLNTGYTSAYGQHIARSVLVEPKGRFNLRIYALQGHQHHTTTAITQQQQEGLAQVIGTPAEEHQQSSSDEDAPGESSEDASSSAEAARRESSTATATTTTSVTTPLQDEASTPATAKTDTSPGTTESGNNQRKKKTVHWSLENESRIVVILFVVTMTENQASGASSGGAGAPGGMPFYEQSRAELKEMLTKRREMAKKLAAVEDTIYTKESEYLESTPSGNVLIGFEPLIKGGTTAAAAQRRKVAPLEHHRVFSRSSISYNANMADSAANTPGSSHAPTPVSSTFGPGSNHATPTSATAAGGSNSGKTGGASRKEKRKGLSVDVGGDSESDINPKKVRTNFGASRK
ncbi:hypothetical protein VMCG_01138 [Cytospora schulzeri]|uniref:Chromatin modification-related protein EAF6 n=1 Tax=Cytospora schulzeri TaxID=448051 RepID=A0A423X5K2_9PEZI|nr:hypothetical protein VMCG_01138 [Valsa malicola]